MKKCEQTASEPSSYAAALTNVVGSGWIAETRLGYVVEPQLAERRQPIWSKCYSRAHS